jgi:hypothetical protein
MRWEDETRLVQTQSGDHVELEKCNLEALMTAGCGDLSLHVHTRNGPPFTLTRLCRSQSSQSHFT